MKFFPCNKYVGLVTFTLRLNIGNGFGFKSQVYYFFFFKLKKQELAHEYPMNILCIDIKTIFYFKDVNLILNHDAKSNNY